MEFILELLFDIIVEGNIELGSEKKVPMPLRIIALLVVWIIFFGMGGIFIYESYEAYLTGAMSGAWLALGVGVFLIIGGIFIAFKMFRKKKENKLEKEII